MSKVSIEQFVTTREMVELANLRFVDERNLFVPVEPKAGYFNKKDVLCSFTPGEQPATVAILEELLAHAKAGRTITPEYGYEECTLVVYGDPYTDHADHEGFAEATVRYDQEVGEYNTIIVENKKNREIRDMIATKAKERLKIIMSNKENRERFQSLNQEAKNKMLEEFI